MDSRGFGGDETSGTGAGRHVNPLALLRRHASRRRDGKRRPELTAFNAEIAGLRPGDVAIDCGAHVGRFTAAMAESGAKVYAFEPNPDAFARLQDNVAPYANVECYQAAVTTESGPVRLYLHKYAATDPVHFSSGSSLVESKRNVRKDRFTVVAGIGLADFLKSLDRRVRLLKMDIEGAEVDVLNQLLDEGLHARIDKAFVEVHDRQIRSLAEPTRRLRERLSSLQAEHFRLDWR